MARPLRLIGMSLTKYGKKRKIVIDLPIQKGLIGITTRNNKQYLLIGRNGFYVERIIVFNPITEQIETDFTSSISDNWYDYIPLTFSDNGSFVLTNGTYFKYDTTTKTYQTISLDISSIWFTKWLSNRFIVFSTNGTKEFDLNGNLIRDISLPFNPTKIVDIGNKVIFFGYRDNKFYTLDLNTYEVREYTIPFSLSFFNGYPIQLIKGTNKVHIYDGLNHKLYQFDLDTEQLTLVRDFSTEDFTQYDYIDCFFSNDGKIAFLVYSDMVLEVWAYNVETNEIRRIPLIQYPTMILEDSDSRIFLIVDCPFYYNSYIYDYNNDKIIGSISNFSANPLYTDGKILLMV